MIKKMLVLSMVLLFAVAAVSAQTYSYKGTWSSTTVYNGDWKTGRGDTVEYGTFNSKKLYWWCQWWSQGDTPGQFAPEGGTSPWVLINSNSFDPATKTPFVAKVWNGGIATTIQANQAVIPTWRDGAEGAYTIIHDDIGALTYASHVAPALEINRLHPKVKVSWGVFVGEADDTEFGQMKTMVAEGHEMTCHSQNHTSAADQWYWVYPDSTIPTTEKDPVIPVTIGGLKVVAFPQPTSNPGTGARQITMENDVITMTYTTNWTGVCPDATKPITITPKAGTVTLTLKTGQKQYVKYTTMDTITGKNTGLIAACGTTWYDAAVSPPAFNADGGMEWFVAKIWAVAKWAPADYAIQITTPKNTIDAKIYTPLAGNFGPYFPPAMLTSYYCYPYDAYSEATHDSLNNRGYISARGGAKSGRIMPGDFFHPFRLDFDAFYMFDANATTVFPANPHSRLGLDAMVDSIVKYKGYMIRELHAVCNVGFDKINDNSQGGWWGGITKTLYDQHLTRVESMIDQNKLTTYNASEVIRYRMTGNAAKSATLTAESPNYVLKVTTDPILDKYKDEISVIVKLPAACTKMDVKYKTTNAVWGNHPRRMPRQLGTDGTTWSVNVNPFLGDAVLYPNADWTGPAVGVVSHESKKGTSPAAASPVKYRNGMLVVGANPGTYTLDIFAADGKRKMSYAGTAAGGRLALNAFGLAQGCYMARLRQADKAVFSAKFSVAK